jgi:hypothetical protein
MGADPQEKSALVKAILFGPAGTAWTPTEDRQDVEVLDTQPSMGGAWLPYVQDAADKMFEWAREHATNTPDEIVDQDASQARGKKVVGDPADQAAEQVEPQGRQEEKLAPPEDDKIVPVATSASGAVVLVGRDKRPTVNGREQNILTVAQYDVVKALLGASDKGLTKDTLEQQSRHGDARKILKRLANDSSSDWASVIPFPGRSGKGYRIR